MGFAFVCLLFSRVNIPFLEYLSVSLRICDTSFNCILSFYICYTMFLDNFVIFSFILKPCCFNNLSFIIDFNIHYKQQYPSITSSTLKSLLSVNLSARCWAHLIILFQSTGTFIGIA